MNTTPTPEPFKFRELTRQERAFFVKEARRLRAEEFDRLFRAIGRGFARLGRILAKPVTSAA